MNIFSLSSSDLFVRVCWTKGHKNLCINIFVFLGKDRARAKCETLRHIYTVLICFTKNVILGVLGKLWNCNLGLKLSFFFMFHFGLAFRASEISHWKTKNLIQSSAGFLSTKYSTRTFRVPYRTALLTNRIFFVDRDSTARYGTLKVRLVKKSTRVLYKSYWTFCYWYWTQICPISAQIYPNLIFLGQ